jgi:fused signal recognition particle receptor
MALFTKLTDGITGIFTKRKLDDEALSELEDLLIEADMGAATAAELVAGLSRHAFEKEISPEEVKKFLAGEIAKSLQKVAAPFVPNTSHKPAVVLVVGVNGSGKTTTIGKLANKFKADGYKVMLAAADTFRAAAVEQLQEWGKRSNIPVITGEHESDPASVAYKAYEVARTAQSDILLVDTAGRLHNKANLMAELQKISSVLKKIDANAPHHVIQVLDATIGQNTLAQVQSFKEMANVSGLILTKLDGTAKGGVVVALAKAFGLPVHLIGVGEGIDDLKPFKPIEFSSKLVGLTS